MRNSIRILILVVAMLLMPMSLHGQEGVGTDSPTAVIERSAQARSLLATMTKHVRSELVKAYELRLTLPLAPKSLDSLSLNETVQILDSYFQYKNMLIRIYDVVSYEDNDPYTSSALFARAVQFERSMREVEALSKTPEREIELAELSVFSKRLAWTTLLPNDHSLHLFGQQGYAAQPVSAGAFILPHAIELDLNKKQAQAPTGAEPLFAFNPALLLSIQKLIDPVEEVIFELEAHLFELEQAQFAELESQGKAPDEEINEELPPHAQTEIRIQRYRNLREGILRDFKDSYFRLLLKNARFYDEISLPDVLPSDLELSKETNQELRLLTENIKAEMTEPTGKPMPELEEELRAALDLFNQQEIANPPDMKALLVHAISDARSERIKALRASIHRQRLHIKMRKKATQRQVASIAKIDDRIQALEERYDDERIKFYGFALLWAFGILFGAWIAARIVRIIAKRIVKRFNAELDNIDQDTEARAKTISVAFTGTFSAAIWVVAFLMILGHFGVNYQPLLVATGGIGLAIGFGAQSLVKDFFSGFFILLENQFTVGDVITIDGKTGTVDEINLRTTRMRSLDGTYHTVPNGQISSVSNMTHKWSRMLVVIGAGYREDPDQVRAIINRVGANMYEDEAWATRLLEPPVVLGLDNLNASSIDFKVVGRTRSGDQWAAEREFRRRVKIEFDLEDIEIPFQYVNYVQTAPEKSRVLKSPSPSMRKAMVEAEETEVWDEGGAKREKDRARENEESANVAPEKRPTSQQDDGDEG